MPIPKKKVITQKPTPKALVNVEPEAQPAPVKVERPKHWTDPDAQYAADDQSIDAQLWRMRPQ